LSEGLGSTFWPTPTVLDAFELPHRLEVVPNDLEAVPFVEPTGLGVPSESMQGQGA